MLCSGIFDAGRTEAQIAGDELRDIYPEYNAIVPTLNATVDRKTATVTVAFDERLQPRRATWNAKTGCTTYPIDAAPPPIVATYATPPAPVPADPRPWPMGDAGIAPKPSLALSAAVARAFDAATYGKNNNTIAVVVLKDGKVVAERYRDGWGPFAANRTWSVGKSIAGSLIGIAVGEKTLNLAAPARIPEWPAGDPRRQITLDNLLRMASGLHSDTAGNRTDAIYFGGATVTEDATKWPLEAMPGTRFRYANNDILLAMRSLRAALDDKSYAAFPTARLFAPLGMTHTHAGVDWQGNYVISSQIWSTARDLARLGQLWLQDGEWQGKQLLPAGWVYGYMIANTGPQPEGRGEGYGASIWVHGPGQGLPDMSFSALGNRGQSVTVIPSAKLVIVRRAEEATPFDVAHFARDVLAATK